MTLEEWKSLKKGDLLQWHDLPNSPVFRLVCPIFSEHNHQDQIWPCAWRWEPVWRQWKRDGLPEIVSRDCRDCWALLKEEL